MEEKNSANRIAIIIAISTPMEGCWSEEARRVIKWLNNSLS